MLRPLMYSAGFSPFRAIPKAQPLFGATTTANDPASVEPGVEKPVVPEKKPSPNEPVEPGAPGIDVPKREEEAPVPEPTDPFHTCFSAGRYA